MHFQGWSPFSLKTNVSRGPLPRKLLQLPSMFNCIHPYCLLHARKNTPSSAPAMNTWTKVAVKANLLPLWLWTHVQSNLSYPNLLNLLQIYASVSHESKMKYIMRWQSWIKPPAKCWTTASSFVIWHTTQLDSLICKWIWSLGKWCGWLHQRNQHYQFIPKSAFPKDPKKCYLWHLCLYCLARKQRTK